MVIVWYLLSIASILAAVVFAVMGIRAIYKRDIQAEARAGLAYGIAFVAGVIFLVIGSITGGTF